MINNVSLHFSLPSSLSSFIPPFLNIHRQSLLVLALSRALACDLASPPPFTPSLFPFQSNSKCSGGYKEKSRVWKSQGCIPKHSDILM